MKPIKAVFFDMDGVLIDTEAFFISSIIEEIESYYNIEDMDDDFYEKVAEKISGLSHSEKFDIICDILQKKPIANNIKNNLLFNIRTKMIFHIQSGELTTKKGLKTFLKFLKENNISTAVCSNASMTVIHKILKSFKIDSYMDVCYSGTDLDALKPSPYIYERALKHFQITASEAMIFEDSAVGITAGLESHCKVVIVDQFYNQKFNFTPDLERVKNFHEAIKLF